MTKKPRRTFDLAKVIESELTKSEPMQIVLGETTITVKPPTLWPDASIARGMYDSDSLRLIMGDEAYAAYADAGGTSKLFFERILPEWQGATGPESPASTDS